jgi:hypothetical protein
MKISVSIPQPLAVGLAVFLVSASLFAVSWYFSRHEKSITALERNWLKGIPCAPPCWENITPGKTTLTETLAVLKQNPAIKPESVSLDPSYLTWDWLGGTGGGQIYFEDSQDIQIVTDIWPGFLGTPNGQNLFTLGEIIDAFGEPSHIHARGFMGLHGDGPFYTLSVYYEDRGIILDHRGLYRSKPSLNRDIELGLEGFSTQPIGPLLPTFAAHRDDPGTGPKPWQGFKSFDFYCGNTSIGAEAGSKCP